MLEFFIKPVTADGGVSYMPTGAGYAVLIGLMAIVLVIASLVAEKNERRQISTRHLTFCAAAIALAVVTSNIKIFHLPTGGSVTLFSMLFITLTGYWYGPKTGVLAAIAYGILQMVIDPYILYPLQVLVDYVLAFGALGLSGFFSQSKNGLIKGYLAGICGRYVFAVLSGWLFFGSMAWEGWGALPYSMVYNAVYIFSEGALTMILLAVPSVSKGLARVRRIAEI
ncbi:energy-coupled thiamine transporter ThiT [Eubacterium callanderi]|uniref:energy-coupled thiamine transporter ThiT n=1 Tax=Eubacterium callanderi TaxID=53442 RepID=UPI0022E4647D|nr:energy-coupled thiamine transporter ThiT [Eubacterium callanderi]